VGLNGPKLSSCVKFSIPLARLLAHALSLELILSLKLARTFSFLSLICMCEASSGALEMLVLRKDIIIKILSKQEILLMGLPRLVKKTIGK